MLPPFRLNKTIGEAYDMDLADALTTKKALASLGHLETPDGGFDEYPDRPLIEAVKSFQRAEGLAEDGVMKPDGPTLERINDALKAIPTPASPPPRPATRPASLLGGASSRTEEKGAPEGTQVAQAIDLDGLVTLGLLGLGATYFGQKASEEAQKKPPSPDTSSKTERTDVAPPPPRLPGYEPASQHDRKPQKTVFPADTVEVPDLSTPLPPREKPTIYVLPAPKPGKFGDGIIERKGNEATRKELERIRDHFLGKGWTHVAGGRYAPDDPDVLASSKPKIKAGSEREERHIKGYFKGLKGGHFTDLTFIDDRGRTTHVQSVDVDKYGKPTQRELDNAEKIRRATENEDVLLIPKGAQLQRNQKFQKGQ